MANNEEIMEMLVKLTEGQTGINNRFDKIDNRLDKIDNRLNKIELVQEEIKTKVITLGELHQAHEEQQGRLFGHIDNIVSEKIDVIETAVKSVSKDTKEIKESIEVLKEMTGKHEVDIKILKRRPV
jgi:chromosome segregation ATPase